MLSRAQSSAQTIVEEDTLRVGRRRDVALLRAEGLGEVLRHAKAHPIGELLLGRPYRDLSCYRAYPIAAVAKVQTIKRAQALGLTLAEIRELLNLKGTSNALLAEQAAKQLREIDATIAELALGSPEAGSVGRIWV